VVEIIFVLCVLGWFSWMFVDHHHVSSKELGRFSAVGAVQTQSWEKKFERFLESLGKQVASKREEAKKSKQQKDLDKKLRAAGLESTTDWGRFVLVKWLCYSTWPVIVGIAFSTLSTYHATVTAVFSLGILIAMPHLWLSRKTIGRKEDILRELPLVIDLTNLATSAGWDTSVSLERVVDALAPEFPSHPLIKELKRASYLAQSGYTWGEVMERVAEKLQDDTVTRVSQALVQAMEHGGDRSAQLGGIAQDAHRAYHAVLDKRLASLPVKALVITMVLFLTYFVVLLAPAGVGVMNNL